MKKYLILTFVAVAALVSCNSNEVDRRGISDSEPAQTHLMTLTCNIGDFSSTKVNLSGATDASCTSVTPKWEADDKILVFSKNEADGAYAAPERFRIIKLSSDSTQAVFEGYVPDDWTPAYACYPSYENEYIQDMSQWERKVAYECQNEQHSDDANFCKDCYALAGPVTSEGNAVLRALNTAFVLRLKAANSEKLSISTVKVYKGSQNPELCASMVVPSIPLKDGEETIVAIALNEKQYGETYSFKFLDNADKELYAGSVAKMTDTQKDVVIYDMPAVALTSHNYFCFTALEDGLQMNLQTVGDIDLILEYSVALGEWEDIEVSSPNTKIAFPDKGGVSKGDKIFVRSKADWTSSQEAYLNFTGNKKHGVQGDITMLNAAFDENRSNPYSGQPSPFAFAYLFSKDGQLADASALVLPSNVDEFCYMSMFEGCENLVAPPVLSQLAIDMHKGCYQSMFSGCTSLTYAPSLLSTTLDSLCYQSMFSDCKSLVGPVELPATELEEGCYANMFNGCSSLKGLTVHFSDWGWDGTLADLAKNPTYCWLEKAGIDSVSKFVILNDSLEIRTGTSFIPVNPCWIVQVGYDPVEMLIGTGNSVWEWAEDGNAFWGNAGHTGNGAGYNAKDIDGKWWGVEKVQDLCKQDSYAGEWWNEFGYKMTEKGPYMVFSEDGTLEALNSEGTICTSQWKLSLWDWKRTDGWQLGKLSAKNEDGISPVLFPFVINEGGVIPDEFDVMYLDDSNMTLVYTNGGDPGSYSEITYWRFRRVEK